MVDLEKFLRDVFTNAELENVLLSVNDGQSSIFVDSSNISTVEPSISINNLSAKLVSTRLVTCAYVFSSSL